MAKPPRYSSAPLSVFAALAAAAIAFAPLSLLVSTPGVAQAAPCSGAGSNPTSCQHCLFYVNAYNTANVCDGSAPRPAPAPSTVPIQTAEVPPLNLPPVPPPSFIPTTAAPPTVAAPQTPTINPPGPGAQRIANVVPPPRGLDAAPPAISAAKAAPATRINPASPPVPPMQVYDFNQRVQNVVDAHSGNVDVVKVGSLSLVRPQHWDYIEYDDYGRPTLFNPLGEAMSFRYFYNGDYREAFVPSGGRIVIDGAAFGVYPFTAVGESHLAAGSFYGVASIPPGGGEGKPPPAYRLPPPPTVYPDVTVSVPADNQTVQVGQVMVVGRDEHQPAGSQDTFLLDDSTLAWGQINDPSASTQIRVTKTQSLPGFGPTDKGSYLVVLAGRQDFTAQPVSASRPGWPMGVGFGGLALVMGLVLWAVNRRKRTAEDLTADAEHSAHDSNHVA